MVVKGLVKDPVENTMEADVCNFVPQASQI